MIIKEHFFLAINIRDNYENTIILTFRKITFLECVLF